MNFKRLNGMISLIIITLSTVLVTSGCFKKSESKSGEKQESVYNTIMPSKIKGLDPVNIGDLYSNMVASNIYETLYDYHYLKRPVEVVPRLAESLPTVSEDGLTYTIKVRKGVKFQDDECFPGGKGRELTAADFAFSIRRLADPKNKSTGWWLFDDKIKGLNEWASKVEKGEADYNTEVEGLKTPDSHTLVITLTKPYYQMIYSLAMVYTAAVPKEAEAKYNQELLNHPVGTGPYILKSWTRGSKVVLEKNPNWAGEKYPSEGEPSDKTNGLLEDAGKDLPFIDKIVFNVVIESQPAWLMFLRGQVEAAGIPKDNFDATIVGNNLNDDMVKKGISLTISPNLDVSYTAFNMEDKVVGSNKKLRQAMSLATNTKNMIEKFYNGRAIPAETPIPPGLAGYDKSVKNPYNMYNADLVKAKQLLAEAGFPEGKGLAPISYSIPESSTSRQMAEQFQSDMSKIGVKIKIDQSSWPQLVKKVKEKTVQMYGMAWSADYPDAENFLQLLYGKNISPGPNGANFKNAEYDKLFEQAALLPDSPDRTELYKKMAKISMEEAPWIFGTHRLSYSLKHNWLKNSKPHPITNHNVKYFRIDHKAKAEYLPKLK